MKTVKCALLVAAALAMLAAPAAEPASAQRVRTNVAAHALVADIGEPGPLADIGEPGPLADIGEPGPLSAAVAAIA